MRRKITKRQTLELIDRIRKEVPDIHLRTTLMVGHPHESEEDFEELLDFVKTTRFERMGAFPYSHEDGTYAYDHYDDQVSDKTKQERMDQLMSIQEHIALESNESKIGQSFSVIIDREDDDFYVGRTEFDSPEVDPEVLICKTKKLDIGSFYDIKITGAHPFDLYGEVN